MSSSRFSKLDISLKYYLHGAKYFTALKAYHYAKQFHSGFRKDKVTPEFQHQIEIALYITTLKNVEQEELAITLAILHDVIEDNPEIKFEDFKQEFGKEIANGVWAISKKVSGKKNYVNDDFSDYFDRMASLPLVALVKGCDRVNNLQTMVGVFSKEKQLQYITEAETKFLPMLKEAANNAPELHMAFMNVRTMIKNQISLVKASLNLKG